jgi:pyruvate/2-oxoglutarate dehydrogenase complex dihydrolipoamide acyltransferase (E2) component
MSCRLSKSIINFKNLIIMKASPVIKKLALGMGISELELASIQGTGKNGSIKKTDLEAFVASKKPSKKVSHKKEINLVKEERSGLVPVKVIYLGKPAQDISVPIGTTVAQLRKEYGLESTLVCSHANDRVIDDMLTISFTKLIAGN